MNKAVAAASGDLFCAQCDAEAKTCNSCSEGSRLTEQGECVRCREAMSHCQTCATGADNQCQKCYKNVAELDDKGHCTNCIEPWVPETVDGRTKCQCPHHINVKAGMKCQKCGDLIPGCRVCEQTDDPARGQITVDTGDDPTVRNDKTGFRGSWLICKQAEDAENMFQV